MKKCIVCEKPTPDNRSNVCDTCFEFLKWKHGKKVSERIKEFSKIERRSR